MENISVDEARKWFGYEPGEDVSLEELQSRWDQWRKENPDQSLGHQRLMGEAFELLSSDIIRDVWNTIPLSSMSVHDALEVFGHDRPSIHSIAPNEPKFSPDPATIRMMFLKHKTWKCPTLEKAIQLDQAYRVLFEYPFNPHENYESSPLEPPCAPLFQKIVDSETKAGWDSAHPYTKGMTTKEASAVFGIEDFSKMAPSDINQMFQKLQSSSLTSEDVKKLDAAYRYLFVKTTKFAECFDTPFARPFGLTLAQSQAATIAEEEAKQAQLEQEEQDRIRLEEEAAQKIKKLADAEAEAARKQKELEEAEAEAARLAEEREQAAQAAQKLIEEQTRKQAELLEQHRIQAAELIRKEEELKNLPPVSVETEKPPAPLPDMTFDEAIGHFVFEKEEDLELGELTRQYKKFAIREGFSTEMHEEIDAAYQVLKAYLETSKESPLEKAKALYGFGPDEIPTVDELMTRYREVSEKTDSKAEQKKLDEAYEVLLKIAS